MFVFAWMLWFLLLSHQAGVEGYSVDRQTSCEGTPCLNSVCYGELGCFDTRPECKDNWLLPDTPAHIDTQFLLFTSDKQTTGKPLNYNMGRSQFVGAGFDPGSETKVLIHGFNNDADSPAVKEIRTAYLNKGTYNIIAVQWDTGVVDYNQAMQDLRVVAKSLELLITQLDKEFNEFSIGNLHILGHSLGAHTAGLTGAHLGGSVGRITGLDPAGPDFNSDANVASSCRLDKYDAQLVDAIHTDMDFFGTDLESGDIDFWPNGGDVQPGCPQNDPLGCSHGRASTFVAVSIEEPCQFNSEGCYGTSCSSNCPLMGVRAFESSKRGNFCVYFASESYPYCK